MQNQLLGGRYRLVRQLGQGGMGHVWEARDEALDRIVAVKVFALLAGGGISGDEARARFLREARITARLQHPGIVTIHDLGEAGPPESRVPFLVMELVRGESLDVIMQRGGVTLTDAARWGAQICDALADAHDAGIMHRDIKPSNILLTASGSLKVLDFGIARAADPYAGRDRVTETGAILGTPSYMAPEQARGFAEPRSDLYALGCLLFELATGQLPLQAPDSLGYLAAHLTDEPPAPSSVRAGIPPVWDELLITLLRKDPAQRHADARELARALRRLDGTGAPALAEVAPSAGGNEPSPTEDETVLLGAGGSGAGGSASGGFGFGGPASSGGFGSGGFGSGGFASEANGPLARTGSSSDSLAHRTGMPPSVELLTRFGLPACLVVQYALIAPLELVTLEPVGRPVLLAAMVAVWALTAVLTPRTGDLTREAGYAASVLVATGLVADAVQKWDGLSDGFLQDRPVPAQLFFDAGLVLTIAAYAYRDLATRRARAGRDEREGRHARDGRLAPY